MTTGMLWQMRPKISLAENISEAVDYYVSKYDGIPNIAFVNPKDLDGTEATARCRIVTRKSVNANHIWLGVDGNDLPLVLRNG